MKTADVLANEKIGWIRMKSSRGFTLLEVIIVVAMIGIMAAIAIPAVMSWAPDYKLKAAARDVYSTLQKARSMAVKFNRDAAVEFDPTSNSYSICDDWDGSACVGNQQTTTFASLGYGIGYGHGNASSSVGGGFDNEVTFGGDNVVFNSRGLGNAGYVYLDHQDNSKTYAIGSLSSGVIRILKWNGSDWE
jgi:prepilin-type N-terminal cleavage/methylation domain-containing protein